MTTRYRKDQNRNPEAREVRAPKLIAWHVTERNGKNFWTRIGAAWDHKDGEGLTLQLDLVPVADGRITLRAPTTQEDAGA